jgi:hypothetical protein
MSDPYAGSAPSGPTPYGPAPYGSAPYAVVPRPPAEPSTGAGWTVVALLSWWPFGLAAYPHTQRATVALASGDREGARAEGAKARRIGIVGLVYGIVVSVVLMATSPNRRSRDPPRWTDTPRTRVSQRSRLPPERPRGSPDCTSGTGRPIPGTGVRWTGGSRASPSPTPTT